MSEHPTPESLKGFLLGLLSAEDVKNVTRHLVAGCSHCTDLIKPLATAMFYPGQGGGSPQPEEAALYEQAMQSACNAALERQSLLQRERTEATAKIVLLLAFGGSEKEQKLPRQSEFWTWGLCELLQEKSWSLRQDDPAGMLRLALLAVEAAQRLRPNLYGVEHIADLLARSWAGLANAYRISDKLSLAEAALSRAFEAWGNGTGSPLLRARLAELSASLLCDQRQFPAAFQLLDFAHSLYMKHHATHDAGRALIKKGVHTGRSGDPEEAVRLLAHGLFLIERGRDRRLVFQALHNILLFRVELGEFRIARRQLWEMRPLYSYHTDRIALVKLRWIEGRIFVGLGKRENATRAFLQAKESFEQEKLAYDAALVSFDLASVWLQEGKRKEVRQLIHEMLTTFRARYIAREAIASLLMLRDAADRGSLSLDLLDMVAGFFQSLKDQPKAQDPG